MTPYIGQLLLNSAAFTAFLPLVFGIGSSTLKNLYRAQVVCLVLAFSWLLKAHILSDFSLVNVIHYSHTQKPWLYKIAGTWGNHEGSMLLWTLFLGVFGLHALKPFPRRRVQETRIILHSALNLLFIIFLLLGCDPFEAASFPPQEGNDLNPLLQDPLLAIHPPFLYAGYVGFVCPFIYVLANLFHRLPFFMWVPSLRPMVLLPWSFLSIGLGLGSFWAYYELGWGGWWFWDPVENITLISWLLGVMLLHTLLDQAHHYQAMRLAVVLTILTFMSTLVGTLLVRSGVLTSLHNFSVDPQRGSLLLALIVCVLGGTLFLIYKRMPEKGDENIDITNRSGIVQGGILLTCAVLFTLFFGTLYPLVSSYLGSPITVGAPYFQMTFVPMTLPILCFIPLIPWMGWRKTDVSIALRKIVPHLTLSGFVVIFLWYGSEIKTLKEVGFSWIAIWIITSTFLSLKDSRLTWRFVGIAFAHGGMGLAILGMVLSSAKEQEHIKSIKKGEIFEVAGLKLKLEEVTQIEGPTYISQKASLYLGKNEPTVAVLNPEKRFYWTQKIIHGKTAIHSTWLSHISVALGDQYENDIWSLKIYYKPYINLLWLGMICVALGGVILSRPKKKIICLAFLLMIQTPSIALEAHEVLSDSLAEQRAMYVGRMLLCPTCAGQNINDSIAKEAQNMRFQVRQLILQGAGDAEILDYFVDRHGEHILYQPALTLSNTLLWAVPWITFALCVLISWKRYGKIF